jgi:hypothetical protein
MKCSSLSVGIGLLGLLVLAAARAAEVDLSQLPPPVQRAVDFDTDVRPIFERSCFQCHGPNRPKGDFRLDDREAALKGGMNSTDDIIPGNSTNSRLIHIVGDLDPDIFMPPRNRFAPLTVDEIAILRAWIDQGASWSFNAEPELEVQFSPALRWAHVEGNSGRFREVEGMNDGLSGGLSPFEHREQLSPRDTLAIEGYALFGEENYQLTVALERRDLGFIRGGFESWREYYDDVGGYAPLLGTNTFHSGRDLHLDVGRLWLDLGITMPDGPEVVLGYEYQFKSGEKSTLQWGAVGTQPPFAFGSDAKNVYPATKEIDEHAHIIKLDLRHELRGWEVEDRARVEFYELATSRRNVFWDSFGPTPNSLVLVDETYQHVNGANTLTITKVLQDWLTVSSGYLYSRLEGHGALNVNTVDGAGNPAPGDQWQAGRIDMNRESQVVSLGATVGPWSHLVLALGAQAEWTQQESIGNENLLVLSPPPFPSFPDESSIYGGLDSRSVRESAVLRWSAIPFTLVSVEARLRQEDLGRFEQRPDGFDPFTRTTDAVIFAQEYRAGFSTSPWSRWTFSSGVRYRGKETDYTHDIFHPSGYLYPGFILWRDTVENQVNARLAYRPNGWWHTAFDYRWQHSEFNHITGPVPLVPASGGYIEAARSQAHVYSLNAVVTPLPQLHFAGTLVYSDSHTATAQNGADYLAPWKGDVYSVISSVVYAVTTNTTLRGSYGYTRSDYGQGNSQTGLPAGIDYDRHAMQVAASHSFPGNIVTSLGYGFYQYHEPTLGGAADYRAHTLFASANFPLP